MDRDGLTRGELLAGLALAPTLAATPMNASAATADANLDALLAQLAQVNGRSAPERVRASGLPVRELMLRLHPWARSFARPPISHFFVGAIVEGASGALYAGMNLEFPGQTLAFTVHGEGSTVKVRRRPMRGCTTRPGSSRSPSAASRAATAASSCASSSRPSS
ncbi:MAG: hypothetical protein ABR975_16935 [Vulcanimicrobiaceae bacterium]